MTEAEKSAARKRRIRTRVQAFIAACTILLVVLPLVLDALKIALSPEQFAVVSVAVVAITQAATLVTRVMNLPAVNDFIERFVPWMAADFPQLGSAPTAEIEAETEADVVVEDVDATQIIPRISS